MTKTKISRTEIPEGFIKVEGHAAFATRNGPYFEKIIDAETVIRAFRADERHLNGVNFVHGGMLMSFADSALARAINHRYAKRCVTVKMNSEFLLPVKEGNWVEAHCEVIRDTRTLAFVRGELKVGHRTVFKADAIFQYIRSANRALKTAV